MKNGFSLKKGSRTPFFMRFLNRPLLHAFPSQESLRALFEMYIRSDATSFARLLQPGPWFHVIPEDYTLKWLLSSIDVQAYARVLAELPIILV